MEIEPNGPANEPQRLTKSDGSTLAYHLSSGKSPTVVFLGGFTSDMTGAKAAHLESFCRARGQAYLRFDYRGHGASSGEFIDHTLGDWADDAMTAIQALTEGPLLLVGSSMGGWLMLLTALAIPDRVMGLIGIAAAPDFTEDLLWNGLDAEQRSLLSRDGVIQIPSDYDEEPYPVTARLIEEGKKHLLLRSPIPLDCPVELLHGLNDSDVPWRTSLKLAEALMSNQVRVALVKGGDHQLSEPRDLDMITAAIGQLCAG